jgi:N-methylhydantoinase B/oxoprolinase/acetone carboxylase alpha subunit
MNSEKYTDPITTEVIRNSLESIVEEMGITIQNLAHSLIFAECKDFSVGLFSSDAELVTCAKFIPGHLGGMQTALEATLKEIPKSDMFPGDVIMMNDSYRGGLHPQDLTLFSPIFYEEQLIMFVGCVAHRVDMGGMNPGSWCPKATEIYQEAIRFPCVRLIEKGEVRSDIMRLFLTNVRLPEDQKGDLQAQIAALKGAERGVKRLVDKYGQSTFLPTVKEILNLTERRTRAEIEKIPDGIYKYTDYIDHDGITDRVYKLQVSVEIKGSDVNVDFTGSDEQAKGFINSPYSLTISNTYVAFMLWLDPSIQKNQGFTRPIKVYAPPRTIFHPLSPAPVGGSTTETGGRVRDLVIGALSHAQPEKGIASWTHSYVNVSLSGIDPKTGNRFICVPLDGLAMGGGARSHADGYMASHPAASNMTIPSIEILEQNYGIRYLRREVPIDAGGDGKFRGGGGLEVEWEIEAPMILTAIYNRRKCPPPGFLGGKNGGPAGVWIVSNGKKVQLPQKVTNKFLKKGDRVIIRTPGGGGYGKPKDRDLELIKNDLRLGFISFEKAKRIYGFKGPSPPRKDQRNSLKRN